MSKRSGIMLAYPMEERRLTNPKFGWRWPVIVQPKLNGERCRVELSSDGFQLLSSECNPIVSVPHINKQISELFQHGPSIALDGELYKHGWDFGEIHSVVSRKSSETLHERSELMEFHIFDAIVSLPQLRRYNVLHSLYMNLFGRNLKLVPVRFAYNMEDLMKIYNNYLAADYEGIIVRHMDAPYVKKHYSYMLKFKPKKNDYYEILRPLEAFSADRAPLGLLGSFECKDLDGTTFRIGAGKLTHKERAMLWGIRLSLPGKFCHVQYQALSPRGAPIFGLCLSIIDQNPEETPGGGGIL